MSHKVFISYHHANDQWYKEELVRIGENNNIFVDRSVDTGDIPDNLSDEQIREKIRDEYLRDSTVTILLVGEETKYRKHVDWVYVVKAIWTVARPIEETVQLIWLAVSCRS